MPWPWDFVLGDGVLLGNGARDVARREDEVPVVPTCADVCDLPSSGHSTNLKLRERTS